MTGPMALLLRKGKLPMTAADPQPGEIPAEPRASIWPQA